MGAVTALGAGGGGGGVGGGGGEGGLEAFGCFKHLQGRPGWWGR